MIKNAFLKKDVKPDESQIREKLNEVYPVLIEIQKAVNEIVGETTKEWKFYGAKNGWILKTFLKKRNLYFISIYEGYFKISFVFGEKAVNAIMYSDISEDLKKDLREARKYAEGRGLTITVEDHSYLNDIKKLISIKVQN